MTDLKDEPRSTPAEAHDVEWPPWNGVDADIYIPPKSRRRWFSWFSSGTSEEESRSA
ncbi:hypothetical protein ACSAGD_02110 [Paramicrobacterium sp. CJ85]|uniref:hypothetical protein n=1 Tax=Paramicrobacterium sp. CJ85 TaxID=3445355 RepID=UPI003F5FBD13